MTALDCLAALVSPLDPGAFFERCYEKEPAHLRAGAGVLLTQDALLAELALRREPPEGLVVFPEHAGAPDIAALLGDAGRLRAYLDGGHPVVWNRARGIWPAVDAVATALAEAFGARVWPNVYATGAAGTPFGVHFDSHEVLAVQCEGHKEWTVSEVRVDRPLDVAEMEPAVAAAQRARCDEAARRPALCFTAEPGDVVYIPRGQFHGARTPGGRSLHVTFGIRQLTGFDVAKLLAGEALVDPFFREFLPPAAADPGGARTAARLFEIAARLAQLSASESLLGAVSAAREHLVRGAGSHLVRGAGSDPG